MFLIELCVFPLFFQQPSITIVTCVSLHVASTVHIYNLLQMRYTRRVSVWPVGLAGYLRYESPVVDRRSARVVGWFTAWKPSREYAVDMAGFAVNVKLIVERRTAGFSYSIPRGEQETFFLRQLIDGVSELEPRASNCTEVVQLEFV